MKHCLWCHQPIILEISWANALEFPRQPFLCEQCENQLLYLEEEQCTRCGRPSAVEICYDCERWHQFYNGQDPLEKNVSIYMYNDFLKEVITKWKYRGDYILGDIFSDVFRKHFKRTLLPVVGTDGVFVPIPLSRPRQRERGFNQANTLAIHLSRTATFALERKHSEKQSKKSRKQRMSTLNPFILKQPIHKPVVLVDDIYTTGRTLRHAAELLKQSNCPKVYAYTLARG